MKIPLLKHAFRILILLACLTFFARPVVADSVLDNEATAENVIIQISVPNQWGDTLKATSVDYDSNLPVFNPLKFVMAWENAHQDKGQNSKYTINFFQVLIADPVSFTAFPGEVQIIQQLVILKSTTRQYLT